MSTSEAANTFLMLLAVVYALWGLGSKAKDTERIIRMLYAVLALLFVIADRLPH